MSLSGDSIYVTTQMKTRINVTPKELANLRGIKDKTKFKLNDLIEKKLRDKYSGKCVREGYVKRGNTIKLIKKNMGEIRSAQFTGEVTYQVIFQCEVYTPRIGEKILARVMQKNEMGLIASASPLEIFIVNEGDFVPEGDTDFMYRIKIGNVIETEIVQYRIEGNHVFAIGKLLVRKVDFTTEAIVEVPRLDVGMETLNYINPELEWVEELPEVDEDIDRVHALKEEQHSRYTHKLYTEKHKISDSEWNADWQTELKASEDDLEELNKIANKDFETMRFFINDYELVWPSNRYNCLFIVTLKEEKYSKDAHKIYTKDKGITDSPWSADWVDKLGVSAKELKKIDKIISNKCYKKGDGEMKIKNTVIIYGMNSIVQYMPLSRAYFKMWDLMTEFAIMESYTEDPINVLSLAEAPGGFIQSIIDYRNYKAKASKIDKYYAITLKKESKESSVKDWSEPRTQQYLTAIREKGVDLTLGYGLPDEKEGNGDLTDPEIIESLREMYKDNKADLITADGDVGSRGPNKKYDEMMNYKLIYGEILSAFVCQKAGGSFALKIKDIYTDVTRQMIHLLSIVYTTVDIVKPRNSRPANSERYLVCKGFKISTPDEQQYLETLIDKMFEVLREWNKVDAGQNVKYYKDRNKFLVSLFVITGDADLETTSDLNQDVLINKQIQSILEESHLLGIEYDTEYGGDAELIKDSDILWDKKEDKKNESLKGKIYDQTTQQDIKNKQRDTAIQWGKKYMVEYMEVPQKDVIKEDILTDVPKYIRFGERKIKEPKVAPKEPKVPKIPEMPKVVKSKKTKAVKIPGIKITKKAEPVGTVVPPKKKIPQLPKLEPKLEQESTTTEPVAKAPTKAPAKKVLQRKKPPTSKN